ncbi:MAG: PKD domain-containing protein [Bacteroidia bacterium]
MNKKRFISYFFYLSILLFSTNSSAQKLKNGLLIKPLQNRVFIKENGQFTANALTKIPFEDTVFYGVEQTDFNMYFSKKGIVFYYPEWREIKRDEENERIVKKPEEQTTEAIWHRAAMLFLDANPNPEIVVEDKVNNYYNYENLYANANKTNGFNFVPAFKKLIYKNIYKGVDLIFELPEEGGIKYKFVVTPNTIIPKIAFEWSGIKDIYLDKNGALHLKNKFKRKSLNKEWHIVDKAPIAYTANSLKNIPAVYSLKNNIVEITFNNNKISSPEGVVIDPWITNTNYASFNRAFDIQEDSVGNIFVHGNHSNYSVEKYNSAGVLQWTYVTYSIFLGDIAVDNPGNVYIIGGYPGGKRQKLDSTGVQQWVHTGLSEEWRLGFNYSKNVLAICGYFINPGGNNLARLDISTGLISDQIAYNEETRAIATDCNGDMYSLHLPTKTIRKTNADFTPAGVAPSGLSLIYDGVGYSYNPAYSSSVYQGINGILVQGPWVYLYDGTTLRRFNKATLTPINSVTVPGGVNYQCSGMASDACGNIYVGTTTNGIVKYDSTLTFIESTPTPGAVYDIILSSRFSGTLLACGAGFVANYSISCTPPPQLNVVISGNDASCKGGRASVSVSGGTTPYAYLWQPGGETTSSIDSLAPGTYTCTVTDPFCHTYTDSITINAVDELNLSQYQTLGGNNVLGIVNETCLNSFDGSATVTVSGGTEPYTYSWNTTPVQTTQTASNLSAGIYTVTVIDADSCWDTLSFVITRNPDPIAKFSGENVCQGSVTHFVDSSSTSSGSINFWSWNFGDATPLDSAQNPANTYSSTGTYNVTLIVKNNFTCADTITKTVTVYHNPISHFNALDVCLNDSTHFIDSSSIHNSANISSHLWVFNDGSPTNNEQNPTHLYSNAGSYSVTLLVTTNQGCANASNKTINVFDPPVANFTVENECLIDSVNFFNTSVNPTMGTIATWSWDFGDGSPLNTVEVNPRHLYSSAGNYLITLITRSSNLACADTTTDSVTIFPMPVATYTANDVCLQQSILFNDISTVTNGNTITNWNWSFGDSSPTETIQNPTHLYDNFGQHMIELIVTTNNSCKDTIIDSLVVHPLPVSDFNFTNVCLGDTNVFTSQSTLTNNISNDVITQWLWSLGDNNTGIGSNTQHAYATNGSYPVQLKVTSTFGCLDSITKTVFVNPNPQVAFSSSDTVGCEPLCVTFNNLSSIATGTNTNNLWTISNGTSFSNQNSPNYCFNSDSVFALTQYSVNLSVTSDSGCVSSLSKNNHITVYPLPVTEFFASPQSTTITDPVINFTNTSIGGNFWAWQFGDGDTSSLFSPPPHTYSLTGTYMVSLETGTLYGCTNTINHQVIIDPDFMFYIPSAFTPNDDGVNDTFIGTGTFVTSIEMLIFDRWGTLVYRTDDLNKPWDGTINNGSEVAKKDVYVYSIKVLDFKNNTHKYKGTITLIR